MDLFIGLSVCAFVCFLIVYHWKMMYMYKYTKNMVGPTAFPIVGNALSFAGDTEQILNNLANIAKRFKHFNKGVRVWLGNTLAVPLLTPEEVKMALGSADSIQKAFVYDFFQPGAGDGLFACKNIPKMKMHRKIIVSTMTPSHLKCYVKIYADQSKILCDKLSKHVGGKPFDVYDFNFPTRMCITGETLLGVSFNDNPFLGKFQHMLDTSMYIAYKRAFKPWLYPDFIFFNATEMGKKQYKYMDDCRVFIEEFARKKVLKYKENKNQLEEGQFKTAIDLLVELTEQGTDITFKDVVDEMLTLIVGAVDGPAISESFVMMMLGMHQDIQEQVYLELKDIFGDSDRLVCAEDLPQMKLLERVIKESMRLFPAGPVVARQSTADIKMDTYILPKDSLIAVFIYEIHRSGDIWEDPLRFDPDRFLPERFSKMHPYAFVPFSGGPRICIGPKYATMSMLCTISTILRRYRIFTPFPSIESIHLKADFMLRPVDGYLVRLEDR